MLEFNNPFQIKIIMAFNKCFKGGLESELCNTYNSLSSWLCSCKFNTKLSYVCTMYFNQVWVQNDSSLNIETKMILFVALN